MTRLRVIALITAGLLLHSGAYGLWQDIIGKEAFLRYADEHWISGWWTIPLELLWIGIALRILARAYGEARIEERKPVIQIGDIPPDSIDQVRYTIEDAVQRTQHLDYEEQAHEVLRAVRSESLPTLVGCFIAQSPEAQAQL